MCARRPLRTVLTEFMPLAWRFHILTGKSPHSPLLLPDSDDRGTVQTPSLCRAHTHTHTHTHTHFFYHDKTLQGNNVFIDVPSFILRPDHFRGNEIAFEMDSFLAGVFYPVLDNIQWHAVLIMGETVYFGSNIISRSKFGARQKTAAC